LVGQVRKALNERLTLTDLEYDIRRMEADLDYHRKKTKIFEETLLEQQQVLSRLRGKENEKCVGGFTNE